jgi:undecaprenyl phosphate-alpha-L-ara4N flippase subunit ArnE
MMTKTAVKGVALMLLSSLCVCVGQLFWKLSGGAMNLLLALGFVCYGAGALLMVTAYRYGSLSVLQPLLSMNYVFAAALGRVVLDESITAQKIAGIAIITASVVFLAGADTTKEPYTKQ